MSTASRYVAEDLKAHALFSSYDCNLYAESSPDSLIEAITRKVAEFTGELVSGVQNGALSSYNKIYPELLCHVYSHLNLYRVRRTSMAKVTESKGNIACQKAIGAKKIVEVGSSKVLNSVV